MKKQPTPRQLAYATSNTRGNEPLVGYVYAVDKNVAYSDRVELILPQSLVDRIQEEEAARLAAEEGEQAAAQGALASTTPINPREVSTKPAFAPLPPPELQPTSSESASQSTNASPDQETPLLPLDGEFAGRASLPVEMFDGRELPALSDRIQRTQKSDKPRLELIEKQLKALGRMRHRVIPACQVRLDLFDELLERFPHFAEVIRIYRTSAKAGFARGKPMAPPPILMLGVPGLGKTHFAQALAACMGLPFVKLAYDSGLTNSELVGSHQHWSNTHHGQLFEHLCLHQVANPVFLLDEIDKAALHYGSKGQSALAALHTCLEPTSSSAVRDISLGVTMDASHVIWLATANYAAQVPQTIRSRFTEVTIRPPVDPEQMYQLNRHICKAVVEPLGVQMPNSVIRTSLAVLSPREQRKHLQSACQVALAHDRDQLQEGDFAPGVIEPMHEGRGLRSGKQRGVRSVCDGEMLH